MRERTARVLSVLLFGLLFVGVEAQTVRTELTPEEKGGLINLVGKDLDAGAALEKAAAAARATHAAVEAREKELQGLHHAEGCQLDQAMRWVGCQSVMLKRKN